MAFSFQRMTKDQRARAVEHSVETTQRRKERGEIVFDMDAAQIRLRKMLDEVYGTEVDGEL